jgi:F-type H+-transporting ATPase subunit epsilon
MRGNMADNNSFRLRIITPDRVFYEGDATMVEFNTTEGEIGVLPGHIPLTVIVSPGILKIYENSGEKSAALHAGFAEILPDGITILAEIIEWPDEIDEGRAEAARHRAEDRLQHKTPETDIARAETALMRAMARIQVLK